MRGRPRTKDSRAPRSTSVISFARPSEPRSTEGNNSNISPQHPAAFITYLSGIFVKRFGLSI